jgi:glycerol-3-phosphate cytidylyltransferase
MGKKKVVGFLAGSFDVLHPGYIIMFEDAKNVCDKLIVGLHSCEELKDPKKIPPVLSVEDRKRKLEAIRYVDEVIIYNSENELYKLLKDLKPDIRILGTDYKEKWFTGKDLKDIKVYFHDRNHDWSTTKFKRLISNCEKKIIREELDCFIKRYQDFIQKDMLQEATWPLRERDLRKKAHARREAYNLIIRDLRKLWASPPLQHLPEYKG